MSLSIGQAVSHTKFPTHLGSISSINTITVGGAKVKVYDVVWITNRNSIPMRLKDEGGNGTRAGYREADLTIVTPP